ncbi:MAG: GMC family oxidoreductase [Leptospirales bacterium]|nr:GMC family oxidoreductase [Leptospirales bacterium]
MQMSAAGSKDSFDFDYVIIGSGFGGSVSAMRLAQKGYSVAVLESGKRWNEQSYPKTNWNIFKSLWFPRIFCYGIQRINLLNHVMILSGAGVGGGSLVYANTLYVPKKQFFAHRIVKGIGGDRALMPFFQLAQRMLGVVKNPQLWEVDQLMLATARDINCEQTFTPTPVGVYFGDSERESDPYFGGEGPLRRGCNFCGGCMVGCRYKAKNTLDKNYLYFAEKLGAKVFPETQAVDLISLSEDGSAGYEIHTRSPSGLFGYPHRRLRTRGVVFSAGVLGTVSLLLKLKQNGRLPRLSATLGGLVRTNSESIVGVRAAGQKVDYSHGIAITSSVHPDEHTHIEPVRYSAGSDVMGGLSTIMTDGGGAIPRPMRFLLNILRHPLLFLRSLSPFGFAKETIILLVMQTLDNSIRLERRRRWIWPFTKSLTSEHGRGEKIPTYIPAANDFARRLAQKTGGFPVSSYNEVLLDVPTTAHILGGACIGQNSEEGVIDSQNRVYGYQNMLVCDGSMIPANPGVNPSLSITAFTERAMSFVPVKDSANYFKFERKWKATPVLEANLKRTRKTGQKIRAGGAAGSALKRKQIDKRG